MELRPNSNSTVLHIASVAVHLLVELATNPALQLSPMHHYAFLHTNINDCFILAGPEDVQAMVLNAMGATQGGHTRYQCTCGCIQKLYFNSRH